MFSEKDSESLPREQLVSGEALRTLMAEVEGILNGRPLTPNSDSPDDTGPLTPNHLLLLRLNWNLPPGVFVKKHVLTPEVSNNFLSLCFYFLNYYNSS